MWNSQKPLYLNYPCLPFVSPQLGHAVNADRKNNSYVATVCFTRKYPLTEEISLLFKLALGFKLEKKKKYDRRTLIANFERNK